MIRKVVGALGRTQAKVTNKLIDKLNVRRERKKRALLVHAEAAPPSSIANMLSRGFAINPNQSGNCSAYATRVTEKFFGRKYEYAPAWKLASKNKLVVESHFDPQTQRGEIGPSQLRSLIKRGILKPGMMLGLYYPESKHNKIQRKVTHIMIYTGDETFWHNYGGINSIKLLQIYFEKEEGKRALYPVQVIDAKETLAK